eukprot:1159877-Pelagomonas_calceolata.AAC.1
MWAGRPGIERTDSIRAALMPGRGASTIREKPVRESSGHSVLPLGEALASLLVKGPLLNARGLWLAKTLVYVTALPLAVVRNIQHPEMEGFLDLLACF